MSDADLFTPLVIAIIGLIVGYIGAGDDTPQKPRSPVEKFFNVIKWISIIVIAGYILLIVAALTDGIGDIPLIGGAVWVRGHWRRKSRY
jgi:magnesium-transporting ATPase (P-type)